MSVPSVGERVRATVIKRSECGVYVNFPDYGNIEGAILTSELTRRKPRDLDKYIQKLIGKEVEAVVLRVQEHHDDLSGTYIDASIRKLVEFDD